jgi:2-keto-4-pentenoate hydratase/2-oxohepta-3-ene-1,7-dioic acid hydratase in catechol pathway
MKLYTFSKGNGERLGVQIGEDLLLDLNEDRRLRNGGDLAAFSSMQALIAAGPEALQAVRRAMDDPHGCACTPIVDVRVLPPLPRPNKIRDFSCYERHLTQATDGAARMLAKRSDDPDSAYLEMRKRFNLDSLPGPGWYEIPAYYYSDSTTVSGHDDAVTWPAYSSWPDYELELAAIIGIPGKDIKPENAFDHIFGYTIFNDLSARDAQFEAMSTGLGVAKGKDFDGSNVLGPCIVTKDEIPDPYALTMHARVNGEEWSRCYSREARWRFPDCIAYASQSQMLHPGEIFCTGAAADGCALEKERMLAKGDVVELEIQPIGVLRTFIV